MRYRSRRAGDAAVRLRIRELAAQRRRFGYRRLHLLLTREGYHMNQKRFRRLYRDEKLQVRKRGGRKRASTPRPARIAGPNIKHGVILRVSSIWLWHNHRARTAHPASHTSIMQSSTGSNNRRGPTGLQLGLESRMRP